MIRKKLTKVKLEWKCLKEMFVLNFMFDFNIEIRDTDAKNILLIK